MVEAARCTIFMSTGHLTRTCHVQWVVLGNNIWAYFFLREMCTSMAIAYTGTMQGYTCEILLIHITLERLHHTDMHKLFVQPDYYGYHWHGLSFTVKSWASRGIHAMYEQSCLAHTWSQRTSCRLSLVACLVTWSSDSESKLPCVLPMHSTWIVFTLAFFHADPAVWQ